jgi:molybdopterin molybdotransferase
MISPSEAHARLMRLFSPLPAEEVPLAAAAGRVLASEMVAMRAQPPFAASAMDGYAVRSSDAVAGARLEVIGSAVAGAGSTQTVTSGKAVRIFTGAPMPEGADRVVIQEDVDQAANMIVLHADLDSNEYVRAAGADFAVGKTVHARRRLSSADVALLAAMGFGRLCVARRPIIALIPTGDELVMPGETAGPHQIVASSGFGLKAMLEAAGAEAHLLPIARDNADSLTAAFDLAVGADLIVTLGGASVGDFDLVQRTAVERGLDLDFYRIAMRPGKPLMAGTLHDVPMIGLPGNPVSAMVTGRLFLTSAVDVMLGLPATEPCPVSGSLVCSLADNGMRTHYMRAHVKQGARGWLCEPFERQDSSLLSVLAEANALLVRPPADPARKRGDQVEFIWL